MPRMSEEAKLDLYHSYKLQKIQQDNPLLGAMKIAGLSNITTVQDDQFNVLAYENMMDSEFYAKF
jgi:hypothetical protein